MREVDYLVVGLGLAGIAFCEQLRINNKSFVVYDHGKYNSSEIAGGVYNPIVLKRYALAWKAQELLEIASSHYSALEKFLNTKLDYSVPILRRLTSTDEQRTWKTKSALPDRGRYMVPEPFENTNNSIHAPFGFGQVLSTGKIDTEVLISFYKDYLESENKLEISKFNHTILQTEKNTYLDYHFKNIVFAEGFGLTQNTFFPGNLLKGTKGEILIIKSPDLKLKEILKSSVFVIPLDDDNYYVGATYEHSDKSCVPTVEAKTELCEKLDNTIGCHYEVVDHLVGIRPTVRDRRPIVGSHPHYSNMGVLNGLGTRGVMIAPYAAQQLYQHLENGLPVDTEIDLNRFGKKP